MESLNSRHGGLKTKALTSIKMKSISSRMEETKKISVFGSQFSFSLTKNKVVINKISVFSLKIKSENEMFSNQPLMYGNKIYT